MSWARVAEQPEGLPVRPFHRAGFLQSFAIMDSSRLLFPNTIIESC